MSRQMRVSAMAFAVSVGWVLPAQAQVQTSDAAAVQRELAAMRAQMERMAQRIDTLEGQLSDARAKAEAAQQAAATIPAQVAAAQQATAPSASAKPPTQIAWDGAPRFTGEGGWSFKPRGRVQVDVAGVNAPSGIAGQQELGIGTEIRRAFLGFDGTMPGGFGYRAEVDVANVGSNATVELTDLFLTYKANPEITFTVGQHKPFWSMEELTSDLFTSFLERTSFTGAFGFERRVGASVQYSGKTLLVQGGIFTDNVADLSSDRDNSYSLDGRVVFMPKIGPGTLHVGGSAHFRQFNDQSTTTRYRARPFTHTTDLRLIDTGAITATGERSYGAELGYFAGRFHAMGEAHWITARRPGLADPTFNGGYAELGYLLTDDVTPYKAGVMDRLRPKKPVGSGGIGAVQVNARYDWIDLSDAGIVGGRQDTAGLSVVWVPTDYVRFLLDYGHLWIRDAALPAGVDRSYAADVIGMRAQFDF